MYKKVLTIFIALFFVACGPGYVTETGGAEGGVVHSTPILQATATAEATQTATLVPTATVDWQGTAVIAQQTADEARRLNTQATAEFEQRVQEQMQMTAAFEAREFEKYSGTATAALTAVPATQTQQSISNTQVAVNQTLTSSQMTAVKEAPTQMVAMTDAENYAQYWLVEFSLRMMGLFALSVFMLGVGVFAFRARPKVRADQPANDHVEDVETYLPVENEAVKVYQTETVIRLKQDNGQGTFEERRLKVPCSTKQLTAFADGVINQRMPLSINAWEGKESPFTRGSFTQLRHFLQVNRLAQSAMGGTMVLTADGEGFLRGWLDKGVLPYSFEFSANGSQSKGDMTHVHENHAPLMG